MIWHVRARDFVSYLLSVGFGHAGRTSTHDLYRRGDDSVFVRRAQNLTQLEVDRICDENDLDPPQLDAFFGD